MNFKKATLTFLTTFLVCSAAWAQSSAELQKQRERLNREIAELQQTIRSTTNEKILSQKQVNALSTQLNLREQKINTISSELRLINNQIASNNTAVKNLLAQLEKLRKDYEKMILFAFRNKNAYNKMMFIFASKDFNQGFKRVKYLQQFNDSRKIRANEIEETQNQIRLKIAQLESDKKKHGVLLAEQQGEKDIIAKERSTHSKVLNELVTQERGFKNELSKKQSEDKRLASAIQAAIRREIEEARRKEEARIRAEEAAAEARKAASAGAKSAPTDAKAKPAETKTTARKSDSEVLRATPEAAKLSADFRSNRGRLPWPVANGNIIQNYGVERVGRNVTVNHENIKIRTNAGAAAKAVFSGTVTRTLTVSGNKVVIISHGDFFSAYGNLSSFSVSEGQKVSTGQSIGVVGTDGESGISLIEFSMYQGMSTLNPESWLSR